MKFVRSIFPIVLLLFMCVPVQAQQGSFAVKHKQVLDLNADGRKEVVELFARDDGSGQETGWKLVVDGKEVAAFDNYDKTYKLAEMEFDDVLHDLKPAILLYFHTGHSGMTVRLTVFQMFGNQFKQIFDNPVHDYYTIDKHRFSTKYLGNLKIEFVDKKTGMKGIIPINPKERYPGLSLDEVDKKLKYLSKGWVDPASSYRIENMGEDGYSKPKDIVIVQRVSGTYHADVIANFETRYSFDKKNQKYIPVKVSLYSFDAKKQVAEKPLNK